MTERERVNERGREKGRERDRLTYDHAASEQRGNNLEKHQNFYLKAKARICADFAGVFDPERASQVLRINRERA